MIRSIISFLIKILVSIFSALVGLVLIPTLALDKQLMDELHVLIIYFLPGLSMALLILFEFLTRVRRVKTVYDFIQSKKMIALFFALLLLGWVIIWQADKMNDMAFNIMFATGTIAAIWLYNWLGKRLNLFFGRNRTNYNS